MLIYLGGAVLFAVLLYVSAKEEIDSRETVRKIELPFYRMSIWIVRNIRHKKGIEGKREAQQIKLAIMILFCGLVALPVLDYATTQTEEQIPEYILERPEQGEGEQTIQIQARKEEEDTKEKVSFVMKERKFTEKEKKEILQKAKEEIDQTVIGDNETADAVRKKVNLSNSLQEGKVSVYWTQEPMNLLDDNGNITDELPDQGEILILQALLNCDGMEETYEFALHLMPEIRTEEEEFAYELHKALEKAMEESNQDHQMELPRQIMGKNIVWSIPGSNMTGICVLGIILLSCVGYYGKAKEFQNEDKNRERQLLLDYPDVVFKLGMLLNAGLTIQNAFARIAEEYRDHNAIGNRPAYDEMIYACNEMQSGISEAKAYENFGRRCGQPCYIRLGTTLSGGLQKSAEGITAILLKESDQAMEDRRLLAKKMGEEAGTKLMFPMILMLLVVMVILMVPAMLSF